MKESEWQLLDEIAALSDGLVPLEEAAIADVDACKMLAAQAKVFGDEYCATVDQINAKTENAINVIQTRFQNRVNRWIFIQFMEMIVFAISFVYIMRQFMSVIKFSEKELLLPIEKVSEEMKNLANGDFTQVLDLKEDESEVGIMVSSIATMKKNNRDMINEISLVLGAMGEGDYQFELKEKYVGAFVEIKDSIEKIGGKMRSTLLTMREVTQQIDSGAEQLSCAAQDLAEGTTKQAMQVSDLVDVVETMTCSMEEVIVNVKAATEKMDQIAEMLHEDVEHMHNVNSSILEVSEVVDNTSATSEETAAVSEEQKAQVDIMVSMMDTFSI